MKRRFSHEDIHTPLVDLVVFSGDGKYYGFVRISY